MNLYMKCQIFWINILILMESILQIKIKVIKGLMKKVILDDNGIVEMGKIKMRVRKEMLVGNGISKI